LNKRGNNLIIQDIFGVLYSPLRAFERIVKSPDVKGPLFILFITLLASICVQYISSSKTLLETERKSGVYTPLVATSLFNEQLMLTLGNTIFLFFIKWFIYGSTFLLILKLFKAKEGPWHQLFIVIGYSFIVATVFIFVNAIVISMFPPVRFDFGVWSEALRGNEEMIDEMVLIYQKSWGLAYQLKAYFSIIVTTWTAALGAVAIHFLREIPWNKALIISMIVSTISLFLLGPLAVS